MHILITGAAGMIGRKLVDRLAADGALGGRAIAALTLLDIIAPASPAGFAGPVTPMASDLSAPGAAERAVADRPEIIFHLAAVVSGEAEADLDKGYRVNLDGTRALFEAIRRIGRPYCPRVVFTSSIAAYGGPFPDAIGDDFLTTPQTSYGTQKVINELLLADYTRRGFLDGIGLRLPNICIRPGGPNKAASGFFSNILREPLRGQETVLPVGEDVRMWHASPRSAVGFLTHAATIDLASLGARRSLMMPGVSATVGEQIEALRRVAGDGAANLIRREPDPMMAAMFQTIPGRFDTRRADALGFRSETSFEAIIRAHIEDEPLFAGKSYELIEVAADGEWRDYHAIRRTVLWEARGRAGYNDRHGDEYLAANHPLLLRSDRRSIGTTRLDNFGNGAGAVRLVAIVADAQRRGHGRKLAELVENYARDLGLTTLLVNAAPDAVGYYEKLGWRRFVWDEGELVGISADCVQMIKSLKRKR